MIFRERAAAVTMMAGLCLLSVALAQDKDAVTVDRPPALCSTRFYDPDNPPPQMPPPTVDQAGVTVSEFGCTALVDGTVVQTAHQDDQVVAQVHVDSVRIELRLKITEWISQSAPAKIHNHEDGHRLIAEHFYVHADEVAGEIGRAFIDKTVEASAPDAAAAANRALSITAQEIAKRYMRAVRDQSEEVQQAYDRITVHGTNKVDEIDAINRALAWVASAHKSPQTRGDELLH
jgi:hypothetical protein